MDELEGGSLACIIGSGNGAMSSMIEEESKVMCFVVAGVRRV